jgi:DNA recombination protein RmuC
MQTLLLIIIAVVILGFVALAYFFQKKITELAGLSKNDAAMGMLNTNIQGLQNALSQRLDKAAAVVGEVKREIGTMSEIGRSIREFQELLNSPKMRGNIGEQVLNDSLAKVFSKDHFEVQYRFQGGEIVDAIIKTDNGIIPIDSKFPMEYFKKFMQAEKDEDKIMFRREFTRSVKKHIETIAKKYILPQEGTVDFAVMYVPSENIYYDIIMENDELMEFAREKKIMLVSPNSFFHFLRVIMMGLEKSKLQEQAQRIWEILKGVQQDANKFGVQLDLVSKHITNAKNAADDATSEYRVLSGKIDQVKLLK